MNVNLKRHAGSFWVSQLNDDFTEVIRILSAGELGPFWSLTRTQDEISLVSQLDNHESFQTKEGPWTLFEVDGVLDFGLVGILNALTKPMAEAGISVFAISTFNTDFILVKEDTAEKAHQVWEASGFPIARI
jgi:uncharacterized protein